jgi:hypothetical protein
MMAEERLAGNHIVRRRTRPVSFRLPEHLIYELRKEASLNQEDLGTFGRDLITSYLDWGRHSRRLNLLPVSREFLKDTLEYLPDDVILKIAAKAGRNTMIDLTLLAQGTLTLETFVSIFDQWLRACGMTVRSEKADGYSYVISHSLGRKWSLYLQQIVSVMCEELPMRIHSGFQLRDDTVAFQLRLAHH